MGITYTHKAPPNAHYIIDDSKGVDYDSVNKKFKFWIKPLAGGSSVQYEFDLTGSGGSYTFSKAINGEGTVSGTLSVAISGTVNRNHDGTHPLSHGDDDPVNVDDTGTFSGTHSY
jgi:hypothetical protein